MRFNIYIIDDSESKLDCFKPILNKINKSEAQLYESGFGDAYRIASQHFDLLVEKIEESAAFPSNHFWLIDLKLEDEAHTKVASKLMDHYFAGVDVIEEFYEDMHSVIRDDPDCALALVLMAIFKIKSIRFGLISTATFSLPPYARHVFDEMNPITFPEHISKKDIIAKAAEEIVEKVKEGLKHPVETFLNKLEGENCHASEDGNYACLQALSEFLNYDSHEKFMRDFDLLNKTNGKSYQSPNIFEECLKCFSNNGGSGLPLIGVFIVTWAAFRRLRQINKLQFGDTQFKQTIRNFNASYIHSKDKESIDYHLHIARYGSLIPRQHAVTYRKTLIALYDMMQSLSIHQTSNKSTLQRIAINGYEMTFSFAIGADGKLVGTLNHLHQNLIEALSQGRFKQEHTNSKKILRWWLLSNYSDLGSNDTQAVPNIYHWGGVSRFKVECREGSGTDLKFLALT